MGTGQSKESGPKGPKPSQTHQGAMPRPEEVLHMTLGKDNENLGTFPLGDGEQHQVYENSWKWFRRIRLGNYEVSVWVERVKTAEEEGERLLEYRPICGSLQSPCPTKGNENGPRQIIEDMCELRG